MLAGCWWQQPGHGPGHTRADRGERAVTTATVDRLTEQWSRRLAGTLSEPVGDAHRLITTRAGGTATQVLALAGTTGATTWSADLPGFATIAAPTPVAFAGDDLAVGSVTRFPRPGAAEPCADLRRLDPGTGATAGTTPVDYPTSAFVTSGSIVAYVDSQRCHLRATSRLVVLDRATLVPRWTSNTYPGESTIEPTVADGRIYARLGGQIQAFAAGGCGAATCSPVWAVSSHAVPEGQIAAVDGRVYVPITTADQPGPRDPYRGTATLLVLAAATGDELWRAEHAFASAYLPRLGALAVGRDAVYVTGLGPVGSGQDGPRLEAYPVAGCGRPTCEPAWSTAVDAAVAPAVAGDVVYVATTYTLAAYPAGGCGAASCPALATVRGRFSGPEQLSVIGGRVLVVETDHAGAPDVTSTVHAFGLPQAP
jgi:outer membrane protein assembly factor BamB